MKNSCNVWDQCTLEKLWTVFNTEPQSVASCGNTDTTKGVSADTRLEEEKPAEVQQVSTDGKLANDSGANGMPQCLSPNRKGKKDKKPKRVPTMDDSLEQNGERNGGTIETSRKGKKKRKKISTVPDDFSSALEQNGEHVEPVKKKKRKEKTEDLVEPSVEEEKTISSTVENGELSKEKKKKKKTSTALKDSQNGVPVESSDSGREKKKRKDTLMCKKRALEGLEECEPHKHKKRKKAMS